MNVHCRYLKLQGTMMLRTQCLQCESSRERQEDFHDISVPVRVEKSDSDIEDGINDKTCYPNIFK